MQTVWLKWNSMHSIQQISCQHKANTYLRLIIENSAVASTVETDVVSDFLLMNMNIKLFQSDFKRIKNKDFSESSTIFA